MHLQTRVFSEFNFYRKYYNAIYNLPFSITKETKLSIFQYKIIQNILLHGSLLHKMKITDLPLCKHGSAVETLPHIFVSCDVIHHFYWVASMAKPSRNLSLISSFFYFSFLFFSLSVKVLPVTPLLSGVFVHRAFFVYFLRIERVVGNV